MALFLAYVVDVMIGDPRFITHPVVYMGKWVKWLEHRIRNIVKQELTLKENSPIRKPSGEGGGFVTLIGIRTFINSDPLKKAGVLLPVMLISASYLLVFIFIKATAFIHPALAIVVEVWFISTTIAIKGLAGEANKIYQLVNKQNINEARKALSLIVGRDTDSLDEREVSRATIETVVENIVDAIVAPLFYAAIGGAPLAMAYRAVNTLDSMVGYKNDQYKNLGWASARLDDLANYIPARITGGLIVLVSWMLNINWRQSWEILKRDAKLHPSPNSGIPEAATAGALGIRLGGTNYYNGIPSDRAKMGNQTRPIQADDILTSIKIMKVVAFLFVFFYLVLQMLVYLLVS